MSSFSLEECFLFKKNGSNNLVIAFSSYDLFRKENGKFNFFFLTKWEDTDVLLVRDVENSWYQEPVAGDEQSSDKMFEFIKKTSQKYRKVICIGSSMGGYGAIFFGHRLKNASIISICPQVFLEKEKLDKIGDYRHYRDINRSYYLSKCKENTFIGNMNPVSGNKIVVFFGSKDKKDLKLSRAIKKNHSYSLFFLKNLGHAAVDALHGSGALALIIRDALEGREPAQIAQICRNFSQTLSHKINVSFPDKMNSKKVFFSLQLDPKSPEVLNDKTASFIIEVFNKNENNPFWTDFYNFTKERGNISQNISIDLFSMKDGNYRIELKLLYKKMYLMNAGYPRFFIFLKKKNSHVRFLYMKYGKKYYASRSKNMKECEFITRTHQAIKLVVRMVFSLLPGIFKK